jgi:hypothetical protein
MCGFISLPGNGYEVALSDGRVLSSAKREVVFVDANRCVVDGGWVYRRVISPAASMSPRPVVPSEYHPSFTVGESHLPTADHRTRKVTIHFADGQTITKLLEPAAEPQPSEPIQQMDQPGNAATPANSEPQGFGNGVRNILERR